MALKDQALPENASTVCRAGELFRALLDRHLNNGATATVVCGPSLRQLAGDALCPGFIEGWG